MNAHHQKGVKMILSHEKYITSHMKETQAEALEMAQGGRALPVLAETLPA